eukprot:SAG11_NODE_30651_length_299_cov_0.500000_1_plen_89_part_10
MIFPANLFPFDEITDVCNGRVSLVCGILFFDVEGVPECCTCIYGICGRNSTQWTHGNRTGAVEGATHCEETEADNGLLEPLVCALVSLP